MFHYHAMLTLHNHFVCRSYNFRDCRIRGKSEPANDCRYLSAVGSNLGERQVGVENSRLKTKLFTSINLNRIYNYNTVHSFTRTSSSMTKLFVEQNLLYFTSKYVEEKSKDFSSLLLLFIAYLSFCHRTFSVRP